MKKEKLLHMKNKNPEFERFDSMMGALLSVPHDKVKAELEAEKKSKAAKRATRKKKKHDH